MQNGLSVDVEDWFQVGAFERTIDRADWPTLECRVEANCDAVLHIFADAGATGTFFTLGRSDEHTSELQSLMRTSYAVFSLKKKNTSNRNKTHRTYSPHINP